MVKKDKLATEQRVQVKLAQSVVQHMHTKTVWHSVRNVINVELKTILAHVTGQRKMWVKAKAIVRTENPPKVGAWKDVTDPAEADTPGQGHNLEVVCRHKTLTA